MQTQQADTDGEQRQFSPFSPAKIHQNRQHYAPKAVIHVEIRVNQNPGQALGDENHGGNSGSSRQHRHGSPAADGVIQCVYQTDGEGKGHENALVERAHGGKIGDLAQCGHAQKSPQIPPPVMGIAAALGDHVSKKRRGQPSDDPQNDELGQQLQSHMVAGHGEQGQKLQLIPGQPGKFFRLYLHRHSCVTFRIKI